jgi:glycosyltransferase involved in cell wall biosynthesis
VGPEHARLVAQCGALGLSDRVEFSGRVRDVELWLSRAGLVVQPSRFEGFPNAVLEAMGMGAPVISADCPAGPAEIIDNGKNGWLVPVEDAMALARAMERLLADASLRQRLGHSAIAVRDRYRQEAVMEQWQSTLVPA